MDLIKWIIKSIIGLFKTALVMFGSVIIIAILMMGVVIGMFL